MIDRSTEGYAPVATRLEAVLNPEQEVVPEEEQPDFLGVIEDTAQEVIELIQHFRSGTLPSNYDLLDEVAALSFSMANIATSLKAQEVKQ